MVDITVSIPGYIKDLIDEQIAEGRFENETDILVQAVAQMLAPDVDWRKDEGLREALDQIDRGEYVVVDDIGAYFDRVVQEAHAAALKGEGVSEDIKY
ncbi:MAG TPA: hypothetical protein VD767_02565 [Thermomicrobiales bacterium]|nr:hypothetical protein [Thermomicrobiales bacterium]